MEPSSGGKRPVKVLQKFSADNFSGVVQESFDLVKWKMRVTRATAVWRNGQGMVVERLLEFYSFGSMDCQYGCILSRSSRGSFGGRSGVVLRIVSGAEKKAFDRGGPETGPPRPHAADDRLGWGSGGVLPPQPNTGVLGGAPQDFFCCFL